MKRIVCLMLICLGLPLTAAAVDAPDFNNGSDLPRRDAPGIPNDSSTTPGTTDNNVDSNVDNNRAMDLRGRVRGLLDRNRNSSRDGGPNADKINNAMSAGPVAISANATIMDYPDQPNGTLPVLRDGSNGWTCFPDNPATPGNDPMCLDKQWLSWMQAFMNKATPNVTGTGVAYMLQGGSDASNTDPFATEPPAGQGWVTSPPHIMILNPQRWDPETYPSDMGMSASGPWIMYVNTPYEHLMVPVPLR